MTLTHHTSKHDKKTAPVNQPDREDQNIQDNATTTPQLPHHTVLTMQRLAGNQQTQRMIQRGQINVRRNTPGIVARYTAPIEEREDTHEDDHAETSDAVPELFTANDPPPVQRDGDCPNGDCGDDVALMRDDTAHDYDDHDAEADTDNAESALPPITPILQRDDCPDGDCGETISRSENKAKDIDELGYNDMGPGNPVEKAERFVAYKASFTAMDMAAGPIIGLAWSMDDLENEWKDADCKYGDGPMASAAAGVARASIVLNKLIELIGWGALIATLLAAAGIKLPVTADVATKAALVAVFLTKVYIGMKAYLTAHNAARVLVSGVQGDWNSEAYNGMLKDGIDAGMSYGANRFAQSKTADNLGTGAGIAADVGIGTAQSMGGDGSEAYANAVTDDPCKDDNNDKGGDEDKGPSLWEQAMADAKGSKAQRKPAGDGLVQKADDADISKYDELIAGYDDRIAAVQKGKETAAQKLMKGEGKIPQAMGVAQQLLGKMQGLLSAPTAALGMMKGVMDLFKGKINLPSIKSLGKIKGLFKGVKKIFSKARKPPKMKLQAKLIEHSTPEPGIQRIISKAAKWIKKQIKKFINKVIKVVKKVFSRIKRVIKMIIKAIKKVIAIIKMIIKMITSLIAGIAQKAASFARNKATASEHAQSADTVVEQMKEEREKVVEARDKKAS